MEEKKYFEDDIIDKFEEEVDVKGRKFVIKIFNGPEMDDYANKVYEIDEKTLEMKPNVVKRNEYFLKDCVLDAPYRRKEDGKDFSKLSPSERLKLLNSVRADVRAALITKIYECNERPDLKKK